MSRVLVVEDDKYLSVAYRVTMEKAGFEFKMATDGEEALGILQDWIPQIILLDLIMPRKDGFSTLADIKKDPRLMQIPVLVTSNLGQKEDFDRAMGMGATGFIIKSDSSPEEIVARIHSIVG
ncbi:MAG TPA: response regulator [Candidatus Saccharimonadales bacterium]|nr:response regulator [Candidatus Saccharimonadales bacterium]